MSLNLPRLPSKNHLRPTMRHLACHALALVSAICLSASALADTTRKVWLETTHGPIILSLNGEAAPISTANFLAYVDSGFYDGLIFHRVIEDFVIQAGGYDRNLLFRAPTRDMIQGEAGNGLKNEPYTIAMGLVGGDPNSAQSQFYINTTTNSHLDGDYTVFGQVTAGQATVDQINQLTTTRTANIANSDLPLETPMIIRAVEVDDYPLMPLHTGSWYNEATSGTGFNIEITHDASTESGPLAVVYWYDFDQGEQIWLTGVKTFQWGDHEITLDLVTATSPVAGADFRQPPEREAFETWGTLQIQFLSCAQGRVTFDSPSKGRETIDVVRLTLPTDASCESL